MPAPSVLPALPVLVHRGRTDGAALEHPRDGAREPASRRHARTAFTRPTLTARAPGPRRRERPAAPPGVLPPPRHALVRRAYTRRALRAVPPGTAPRSRRLEPDRLRSEDGPARPGRPVAASAHPHSSPPHTTGRMPFPYDAAADAADFLAFRTDRPRKSSTGTIAASGRSAHKRNRPAYDSALTDEQSTREDKEQTPHHRILRGRTSEKFRTNPERRPFLCPASRCCLPLSVREFLPAPRRHPPPFAGTGCSASRFWVNGGGTGGAASIGGSTAGPGPSGGPARPAAPRGTFAFTKPGRPTPGDSRGRCTGPSLRPGSRLPRGGDRGALAGRSLRFGCHTGRLNRPAAAGRHPLDRLPDTAGGPAAKPAAAPANAAPHSGRGDRASGRSPQKRAAGPRRRDARGPNSSIHCPGAGRGTPCGGLPTAGRRSRMSHGWSGLRRRRHWMLCRCLRRPGACPRARRAGGG